MENVDGRTLRRVLSVEEDLFHITQLYGGGMLVPDIAEKFDVSNASMYLFVKTHNLVRFGLDHPHVQHLPVIPAYKLHQGKEDRNSDFIIDIRGSTPKVYIDINEYIELREMKQELEKLKCAKKLVSH